MIVHPKLDDWRERLDAWVARMHATPFAWSLHDCTMSAAAAFEAQTGIDFGADYRGQYDSAETGAALLRERGFADHVELVASILPEIPVAFARIGDFAAVDFGKRGTAIMLVAGHRVIGPMEHMAGSFPLTAAHRAFAVGRHPD